MTRMTKASNRPLQTTSSIQETKMQDLELQPSTSHTQFVWAMYMLYIVGPKVDWTVNDGLYHRFLKWKLKCENILDCELAMLPECKKVISLCGDFGMDQHVWIPSGPHMKSFASYKPMKWKQDVTCLEAFTRAINQQMSGTILYKLRCVLLNIHKKLQTSWIMISFAFVWEMKNLCQRPSMTVVLILTSSLQAR